MAHETRNSGAGRHQRRRRAQAEAEQPRVSARPLPNAAGGTADVLSLRPPPSLDPLGRLDCPSPIEPGELLDPLADVRRRGVAVVAGVVTGAITLPPMLGMSEAGAAIEPKPKPTPAVTLPARVEQFSPYLGQRSCDPTAKPGVVAFSKLVLSYWGRGGSYGITRACGVGGQSEHKEGRAWDFKLDPDDYADQVVGQRVVDWLLADGAVNARRLGIMYFIWNERIWSAYQREDGWRPYSGSNNHFSHIHFSFSWAGAMKRTSWWTGTVAPIEYGPCQKYIGSPVPVYGSTINLAPCPKPLPKAKPRPKRANSQALDDQGGSKWGSEKNPDPAADKPMIKAGPKDSRNHGEALPTPTYEVLRVKAGQTILGIGHRNHISAHRIVRLIHLKNATRVFVGQPVRVPSAGAMAVTAKEENVVPIVVVKKGDTLSGLAGRYGTRTVAIVKTNNLRSADHIYPGQKLRLP